MSRLKSLIPTLPLLIVSYHMTILMPVITNNSFRAYPLELPHGPLFMYCCFFDSPLFLQTRALLIWVEGEVDEEVFVRSILLNVFWKDETSGLNKICPLTESYSEGSAARKPRHCHLFPLSLLNLNIGTEW